MAINNKTRFHVKFDENVGQFMGAVGAYGIKKKKK